LTPAVYDHAVAEKGAAPTRVVNPQAVIYQGQLTTEELRIKRLQRYKTLFGIASLVLLIVGVICFATNIHYEPALAMFTCTVGTFIVFAMKVNDARK